MIRLAPSRRLLSTMALTIAACTPSTGTDPDAPPSEADAPLDAPGAACTFDFTAVEAALAGFITDGTVGGLAIEIVDADCGTVYAHGFGTSTVDTTVEIASASKVPSMTLVMSLVDEGKLALDAPISTYLTGLPADKASITIRQLMAHLSGMPGMSGCLGDPTTTLAACSALILDAPLAVDPGEFIYGGSDYQVLGRIAEVVGGASFNELFAERVARPCGSALSFAPSIDNSLGSATNPRVAGGAAASARSYAQILALHVNGGRCGATPVLTPGSVEAMRANQTAGAPKTSSPYDDGRDYGFGFWLEPAASGPPHVFSDAGAFGTKPWIDPGRHYAAVIVIRKNLPAGEKIYATVQPLVEAAIDARR